MSSKRDRDDKDENKHEDEGQRRRRCRCRRDDIDRGVTPLLLQSRTDHGYLVVPADPNQHHFVSDVSKLIGHFNNISAPLKEVCSASVNNRPEFDEKEENQSESSALKTNYCLPISSRVQIKLQTPPTATKGLTGSSSFLPVSKQKQGRPFCGEPIAALVPSAQQFKPEDDQKILKSAVNGANMKYMSSVSLGFETMDMEEPLTANTFVGDIESTWKDFKRFEASSELLEPILFGDEHRLGYHRNEDSVDENSAQEAEPKNAEEIPISDSEPLYKGANISVRESLCSILAFSQTEHLTGVALSRLLKLVNLHLPSCNKLAKTTQDFYAALGNIDCEFVVHYYCSVCWKERLSLNDVCDTCIELKKSVHYFVTFPIASQLLKLFSRPGFMDLINYKHIRQKINADNIEDVFDGSLYKEAEKKMCGKEWISFNWNTDGVSLYNSSSFDLHPFYLTINELPPDQRFRTENVILAGLWGSKDKPHPNVFLKNIVTEIRILQSNGVNVLSSDGIQHCIYAIVLCGTCDSPAKSSFLNLKLHSGYYSCPKCMIMGEKSKRTGDVMVFPHQETLVLRDDQLYEQQVANSVRSKSECEGVKGPTLLHFMTFLSLIRSTAVDAMHSVYIGVLKQLLNLWFNTSYRNEPFSLSKKVDDVNMLLSQIELPHFVQRTTVPVDKLSFWKASLCRNFLFYMLLPIFKNIMEPDYFSHVINFVYSISLLNSQSISPQDAALADKLLMKFVCDFQNLYGLRHMSHNVHLLRHLPSCVLDLGPLWCTTCFMFEDLNGRIVQLAHGTRHAVLQVARNFPMLRDLSKFIGELPAGAAKNVCEELTLKWKKLQARDIIIAPNLFTVGSVDFSKEHNELISELLRTLYQSPCEPNFSKFYRLFKDNQLYVAKSYSRGSRISSYVKFSNRSMTKYGEILSFVKVTFDNKDPNFLVLIQCVDVQPFSVTSKLSHIQLCVDQGCSNDLVFVSSLTSVCFKISVNGVLYICEPLNTMELE